MPVPQLQFAQPATAYINTTQSLQKMAASKAATGLAAQKEGRAQSKELRDIGAAQQESTLKDYEISQLGKLTPQQQADQEEKGFQEIARAMTWADTPEKYKQSLDYFEDQGVDVEQYRGMFDQREMFIAMGDPKTRAAALAALEKQKLATLKQGETKPLSPVGKIQKDVDNNKAAQAALDPNDPDYEQKLGVLQSQGLQLEQSAAKAVAKRKGERISIAPDGTVTIDRGGDDLGKRAKGSVEIDMLAAGEHVMALNDIMKNFDGSYQTFANKFKDGISKFTELAGGTLSHADKTEYRKHIRQKAKIAKLINKIRNDLFGSALTKAEITFSNQYLPSLEGWDSDSPTQLEEKLFEMQRTAKLAIQRLYYIKEHGMSMKDIDLDDMPTVMAEEANKIQVLVAKEQPGLTDSEYENITRQRMGDKYGLMR